LNDAASAEINSSSEKLEAKLNDASSLNLLGTSTNIFMETAGASSAILSGTSTALSLKSTGASNLFAADLTLETAEITMTGASQAELKVTKKLNAVLSDAARLEYRGQAIITQELKDVSARIINLNQEEPEETPIEEIDNFTSY